MSAAGWHRLVVGLAALAWLGSLGLPALTVGSRALSGLDILLQAHQALPFGVFGWCANPLFLIGSAAAQLRRTDIAFVTSGCGLVLALTSFSAAETIRKAGTALPQTRLDSGFYLWLAAFSLLFALCALAQMRRLRVRSAALAQDARYRH